MSHFFGILTGSSKAPADRRGSRKSGVAAELGTRNARVRLRVYFDDLTGCSHYRLDRVTDGAAPFMLATGVLDKHPPRIKGPNLYELEERN